MIGNEIVRTKPEGEVRITRLPDGRSRIVLRPSDDGIYIEESRECETAFPLELVEYIIEKAPFVSVCSCISRFGDKAFINTIRNQLFSYFRPSNYVGKRLLDFGCGFGASTFVIASALPDSEAVGVDLSPERIDLARKIAETYDITNASFQVSPSGNGLPPDIGMFDFVTLNAVYEHLLPEERKALMPLVWEVMKSRSVIFVNQTPHRYFPYEHHSTRLWLINYLPDSLAHWMARRFARMNPHVNSSPDWNLLLRAGIRGATEREIVKNLVAHGGRARILQPSVGEVWDRASYWLSNVNQNHYRTLKRTIAIFFRYCDRFFKTIPSLNIDVAIQKEQ